MYISLDAWFVNVNTYRLKWNSRRAFVKCSQFLTQYPSTHCSLLLMCCQPWLYKHGYRNHPGNFNITCGSNMMIIKGIHLVCCCSSQDRPRWYKICLLPRQVLCRTRYNAGRAWSVKGKTISQNCKKPLSTVYSSKYVFIYWHRDISGIFSVYN